RMAVAAPGEVELLGEEALAQLDDAAAADREEVVVEEHVADAEPRQPSAHRNDVVDAVEPAASARRRPVADGARERAAARRVARRVEVSAGIIAGTAVGRKRDGIVGRAGAGKIQGKDDFGKIGSLAPGARNGEKAQPAGWRDHAQRHAKDYAKKAGVACAGPR